MKLLELIEMFPIVKRYIDENRREERGFFDSRPGAIVWCLRVGQTTREVKLHFEILSTRTGREVTFFPRTTECPEMSKSILKLS